MAIAASTEPASSGKMVLLQGGSFLIGSDDRWVYPDDGEGPVRAVDVDGFRISAFTVTNEDFGRFVAATGYDDR